MRLVILNRETLEVLKGCESVVDYIFKTRNITHLKFWKIANESEPDQHFKCEVEVSLGITHKIKLNLRISFAKNKKLDGSMEVVYDEDFREVINISFSDGRPVTFYDVKHFLQKLGLE